MLAFLIKQGTSFWVITSSLFVALVGTVDVVTGGELSLSFFYLIPIVLVTWFLGRSFGIVYSIICAVIWFIADGISGPAYSTPLIRYWNALVRLGFFSIVPVLLPVLKALEEERGLARTDELTGVANRRYFFELAQIELDRSQRYRHPLTVAYIDLDGFKSVNDRLGHVVGDILLRTVANRIKTELRKTDLIARLGGDEFIILFPETDANAAQVVIPKIQQALMAEMRDHQWHVTFSIGVLTTMGNQISPDELVKQADQLMYTIKKTSKNAIAYEIK